MIAATDPPTERPYWGFWQPRYWGLWLGIAVLRLIVILPTGVQQAIANGIGTLASRLVRSRARIAAVNLRLCFPEWSAAEIDAQVRAHFGSLVMSVFEIGLCLWASDARVRRLVRVEGIDNLRAAEARGKGVLLLSGHFASVELAGRALHLAGISIAGMYRPTRNELVDELLLRARRRSGGVLIPKDNVRQMIRLIRSGSIVWYASDQSNRRKGSALIPFFGEPAMTNLALSQIAAMTEAPVVAFLPLRLRDSASYSVELLPALTDFPGQSPEADALRINQLLERHIRRAPEQYYWVHRRFKGRPAEFPDPYARPPAAR